MEIQSNARAAVGPEQVYLDGLAAGRFEIQRCAGCGQAVFYPRCVCPHCGGTALDWFAPSGKGVVYATTTVHRKPEQGGDYNVCLVDLQEGVRMMSQVRAVAPGRVRIGMRVAARIAAIGDAAQVVFEPAEDLA
ncbi:OB-fold domain-containing protein [Achromobacter veterisilvae]|uniref:OB-fold domain-containing protein n=1 Tax=Achromobacter veterisilvae TaxID=2069367 RepID=A0ABZ2RSJ3_9BURK|nr:OB-fold domain-containing protein [Achromobacter sp.]MCW0211012.1 OB-fold domain-containing protein [Achromobacter sp.]